MRQLTVFLAKDAPALGPNPESAIAGTEDVAHANAANSGKVDLIHLAFVKAKQIRCRYPDISIAVLIHGLSVVVGGIGQGHGLHGGLAQSHHAGLGPDPNVVLDIFVQV